MLLWSRILGFMHVRCANVAAICWRLFTAEALVHTQASPWGFNRVRSGTWIFISSSNSDFPYQYHSTIALYSLIHLPPTLYSVFLPVLQFSLSVPLHHCSQIIHPSTNHFEKCFSPSLSVFPISIIPPLLHTHSFLLPSTLYNDFLPVLQSSLVSIIPPLLHTHPSIYHPRCKMFFSQYFSFPLSVSFHHCSILIHSSTTHIYNVFLPVLQFSPVRIIPPLLHTHSFIYPSRYIMFFSQYFSFPLSVSFHHCSILIHPSTTHAVKCFSPSTSVLPCQYHSTIAPYSFIHLPPRMYNVFLPVLQFSPVSIIPPLLHTHSSIYHPRCIVSFLPNTSVFPSH